MKHGSVLLVGASGAIGSAIGISIANSGRSVIRVDCKADATSDTLDVTADLRTSIGRRSVVDVVGSAKLWAVVYASGLYPIQNWRTYDSLLWRNVLEVNVTAVFEIIRDLRANIVSGGRVVVISSAAAHSGSSDPAYSVSKAGLLGLVRSLAKNLASRRIQVNAVCPGLVDSSMSRRMSADRRRRAINRSLFQRAGTPDEIAVAVDFLLDARNTFMTGACIAVDGGSGLA
jgi:NAD(P)-dependent dehydrogenase (short-subunit alcohol dehydrogenase family)